MGRSLELSRAHEMILYKNLREDRRIGASDSSEGVGEVDEQLSVRRGLPAGSGETCRINTICVNVFT